MSKDYKGIRNFPTNKLNPFSEETITHIEKGSKTIYLGLKEREILVDSYGNASGHTVLARRTPVDKAKFGKIFHDKIQDWFSLSNPGIRVFGYILTILEPNSDSFLFDGDACRDFCKYSTNKSVFSGIGELLDNKFIARGKNAYHYYINPTIFFNGNRLTLVEHFELNDKQAQKQIS